MIRATGVALVLLALLWPEVGRYRAEHRIGQLTAAFRASMTGPAGPERGAALARIDAAAHEVLRRMRPGDSRALMLAGSARLMARDPAAALDRYRAALARGERAEIDLALARSHIARGDLDAGQTALVRAAWVSPPIAHTLPRDARRSLLREVKLLARALRAGRLSAPPALPPADQPSEPH